MDWKQLLVYITGSVDQELLVRNEYLVTENRILRQQITGRVRLSDGERKTLGGLVTYYVLFFLHLGSRRIHIAGATPYSDARWSRPSWWRQRGIISQGA